MAVFLALFGVVEGLGVPILTDPSVVLGRASLAAAAAGVALLWADVLLPVPSSVIMVANGALFGFATGAALSLAGSLGAAVLGFALGRRGSRLLTRVVSPAEKARADALLSRYGALAVLVTRAVPLLAETTVIMAGTSPMSWRRMLAAAFAGSLPPCLLYALAGAQRGGAASTVVMFAIVMAVAGVFWWVGRGGAAGKLTPPPGRHEGPP